MAATLIDGKALAAKLKKNVLEEARALPRKPGLAVILVGDDPASRVYVTSKRKDCEAEPKSTFPHGAENRPNEKHVSAWCGKPTRRKARFRTVRKTDPTKSTFPHGAESRPSENHDSAWCGKPT